MKLKSVLAALGTFFIFSVSVQAVESTQDSELETLKKVHHYNTIHDNYHLGGSAYEPYKEEGQE